MSGKQEVFHCICGSNPKGSGPWYPLHIFTVTLLSFAWREKNFACFSHNLWVNLIRFRIQVRLFDFKLFNTLTASRNFTTTPASVRLQQQLIPRSTAPSTAALSLAWSHAVLLCGDSGQATSMPASASTFAYAAVPCYPRDASIEGRIFSIFTSLAHAQYTWTTYIYTSVAANLLTVAQNELLTSFSSCSHMQCRTKNCIAVVIPVCLYCIVPEPQSQSCQSLSVNTRLRPISTSWHN